MNNLKETSSLSILDQVLDTQEPRELERTKHKMLIAAKIEDAMLAKGWKKKDLMAALDINSPSILTRWFSGTHNFKIETLVDIQTVLEVNLLHSEPCNCQTSNRSSSSLKVG